MQDFTIGQLAKAAGITVESVRFYQRKGLLAIPSRRYGNIRRYQLQDLQRLQFIKSAQHLGFSLQEIAELLQLDDGQGCQEVAKLAATHLQEIQQRIQALLRMEQVLKELLHHCKQHPEPLHCPLIQTLQEQPAFSLQKQDSLPDP